MRRGEAAPSQTPFAGWWLRTRSALCTSVRLTRPSSPAFSSPHRRDAPLGTGNLSAVDSPHDFREVFIDEGEVNMIETMQVWKEAGYFGAFCHDHTPHFSRDGGGDTGIAFAVGFMRCCIQVPCSPFLDHISPIFSPFFSVFCAFSPSRRGGSNEPQAGTQGQETAGTGVQTAGNTVSPG